MPQYDQVESMPVGIADLISERKSLCGDDLIPICLRSSSRVLSSIESYPTDKMRGIFPPTVMAEQGYDFTPDYASSSRSVHM